MAQPITVEFLKKNFADYSENNNVYSTTREQSPRCVDVFPCFGKFTISVFDETMDNVFTAVIVSHPYSGSSLHGEKTSSIGLDFTSSSSKSVTLPIIEKVAREINESARRNRMRAA